MIIEMETAQDKLGNTPLFNEFYGYDSEFEKVRHGVIAILNCFMKFGALNYKKLIPDGLIKVDYRGDIISPLIFIPAHTLSHEPVER